jgi:hypothetical protein
MDIPTEIEDIFQDGLVSVFGDITVSHGEPGQVFSYATQAHGYCHPALHNKLIQAYSTIKVHIVNTSSFEERGTLLHTTFPVQ